MHSTTLLADLIQRKHDVLAQLCAIGRRQQEVVERGDTTTLLELQAGKQKMIALLQQLERELAPFHADDPEGRDWASPAARAQCAQLAADCNRLLAEVVELERQSAERLTMRRNDIAAQLRQVHTASQARNAYQAQR
jgi:hypothetical protein